jgi:hypothetical protein
VATAAPSWEELYLQVPDELRPYVLELDWDRERLWKLELPVEEMTVAALAWQLALPWWRDGERYFSVRPVDVLTIPNPHREQFERTMDADLAFPLDVTRRAGRWFVLDGVHRLLKALALGQAIVPVRKVPADSLALIAAA